MEKNVKGVLKKILETKILKHINASPAAVYEEGTVIFLAEPLSRGCANDNQPKEINQDLKKLHFKIIFSIFEKN